MTEDIPDDFNTVRLRLKQLEKRDSVIADKQDRMIDMLYEIKSALSEGERRMGTHSVSIKKLEDDSEKLRAEQNDLISELEDSIRNDIKEIATEVHSKGSFATMLTAIIGGCVGTAAGVYQAIVVLFPAGKP